MEDFYKKCKYDFNQNIICKHEPEKLPPWKRIDEILLSITKNTDFLNKQTQTEPQETLKFKRKKPTEALSLDVPLNLEDK